MFKLVEAQEEEEKTTKKRKKNLGSCHIYVPCMFLFVIIRF